MKKKFPLLVFLMFCATKALFAQLPQNHPYQNTLRDYMGTLKVKDFEVTLKPLTVNSSYFKSIDEIYKTRLFLDDIIATKGLTEAAANFTLSSIEANGQVNMRIGKGQFMNAIATAFWADWNYKGNPHYGSRSLKLRAFVSSAVDMMMQDQNHENGNNKRSDFLGMQLIRWAFPYGVAKGELPQNVRDAYEKGLIRMFDKLEQWGPDGTHADIDMASMVGVLYTAKFVDSQDLTQRAEAYVDKLLDNYLADAGYIDHGSAYDAGYNGISLYFINWAAQISNYPPLIKALQKMSKLKAYVTLPDPDGNEFSPSNTNPSSGGDAPHDLWNPYFREVGIANYADDATYLALNGEEDFFNGQSNLLNQIEGKLQYFNKVLLKPKNDSPGIWKSGHWINTNSLNATAFYYKDGLYDKFKNLNNSNSALIKPPFERSSDFTENFANNFLSVKRKTYGTIISNDRLAWWTSEGQTETLNGFGGGNLSAFWTPETGSVLLGGGRGTHNGGIDLKDWREWPVQALSGETTDGKAFSSGIQRYPEATYELSRSPKRVTIKGDLANTYADPRDGLQGKAEYKRVFNVKENGVEVTTSVISDGSNNIKDLYEILPVYRRNAYYQSSATPTKIEFKVNGSWQQAGTTLQKVESIRLSRFNGQVYIDFEKPAQVKLSSSDFYQNPEKKSGFQARNIMIDLLGSGGQSAKLANTSVSYFMRSSKAAPNGSWNDDGGGDGKTSDTAPPEIELSHSPDKPDNTQQVDILVDANDASGIQEIQLFVNDEKIKTCQDTDTCNAEVGPYKDGTYRYYATATDHKGNKKTTSDAKFTVATSKANDTTPPKVDISHSPSDPDNTQEVTFTSTASDAGGIKSIAIYIDGQLEKTCSDAGTCSVKMDPFSVKTHTYYATAVDNSAQQNAKNSEKQSFEVSLKPPPNNPPVVIEASLTQNSSFLQSEVDNVSDPDGDPVSLNYDWRINDRSLAVVNFPFDINVTSDESPKVKDYTSLHNDGALGKGESTPGWIASGKRAGALVFDGKDDYVSVPSSKSLENLTKFTVEAWIKQDNWGQDWASIISKPFFNEKYKAPHAVFKLSRNSDKDNLNFQITVGDNEAVSMQSNEDISPNTWTHLVGTYDGSDLKLYINGKLDETLNVGKPLVQKRNTAIFIAKNSSNATNPEQFKGVVDEVRILGDVLSDKQVQEHYNGVYEKLSLDQTKTDERWSVVITPNDAKTVAKSTTTNSVTTKGKETQSLAGSNVTISQNYPNPFQSSTAMDITLEKSQKMSVKIYDSLGRYVQTIFEGEMPAGSQTMELSGTNLSSGIYFCRFRMENKISTIKMTLVK